MIEEKAKLTQCLYCNTIFEGLTPAQIEEVLPCIALAVKNYASQEYVAGKGDSLRDLGVVLDGKLALREENGGKVVQCIEKNQLFGEVTALSASGALEHEVTAEKPTRILYLSGAFFLSPCGKSCTHKATHQIIVGNMLRLLSDRTIRLNKQIAYLTAEDLKTKIAMYLLELYELNGTATFTMPLNRDRLAEFFAVARPSLSRELTNLKSQGIIDFHRSGVTLLDVNALYRLAAGK